MNYDEIFCQSKVDEKTLMMIMMKRSMKMIIDVMRMKSDKKFR